MDKTHYSHTGITEHCMYSFSENGLKENSVTS